MKDTQALVLEECVETDNGNGKISCEWKMLPKTWTAEERISHALVRAATGYKYRVFGEDGKFIVVVVKPDLAIAQLLIERFHGKPRQEIDTRYSGDAGAKPSDAARELFNSLQAEIERQAHERISNTAPLGSAILSSDVDVPNHGANSPEEPAN